MIASVASSAISAALGDLGTALRIIHPAASLSANRRKITWEKGPNDEMPQWIMNTPYMWGLRISLIWF
jgi:hypothetical protein